MASSSCGFYVIAWMRFMLKPRDKEEAFVSFLNLFSARNLLENEKVLGALLQQKFKNPLRNP